MKNEAIELEQKVVVEPIVQYHGKEAEI